MSTRTLNTCSADFPVCRIAGFLTGLRSIIPHHPFSSRPADWKVGDTADKNVCATRNSLHPRPSHCGLSAQKAEGLEKPRGGRFQRGFTLVEIMVVMVLIGIVTAMIIPEMKGTFEETLLRTNSRALVSAFNMAYSQSISANQLHRVRIDSKSGRYWIERRSGGRGGENQFVPLRDIPGGEGTLDTRIAIEIHKSGEEGKGDASQGNEPSSDEVEPSQESPDAILFYPDGTTEAAEVVLQDRAGFRLALRLNATTARVQIVELSRK